MKKVININFQGRVIPIEETAYDILKQYIESLRRYFANEEGRDEIINDIESRIAELFSEVLKKGSTCITDVDVNAVIASMGRPEDFEADAAEAGAANSGTKNQQSSQQSSSQQSNQSYTYTTNPRGRRLYRNADDKIIGGVASGIANYFGIDPVILRIVFVLLLFTGSGFILYIIFWIAVPSQSIQSNITKRLYRSADDKVFAGVAGGLAAYFNISTWVPRLIFALPLIIALISGPFNFFWDDWDFWRGPRIITGSLSSTLFITYIILWIVLPVAVTAAEKLEMRGERVDLNSIRNTVKEDLESFKTRAQNWGNEVKQSAQEFGEKAKDMGQSAASRTKTFSTEAGQAVRSGGSGIGHIIGVLFKAFFLFIAGIIAVTLFFVFMALIFGGFAFFPIKDFFLDGFWQNAFAWLTLFLFLGIPLVSLSTWLIRRIMGVRSKSHYLGYVFGSLWIIGLVSCILLVGFVGRNFKNRAAIEDTVQITPPSTGKILIDVESSNARYYGADDWFDIDWQESPFYGPDQDTLLLNTVRIDIVKSIDSAFHVTKVRFSRGNSQEEARRLTERINFNVTQRDSVLLLSKGFAISRSDKFRNQQVMIVVAVPVGKRFYLDRKTNRYDYFSIRYGVNYDDRWDHNYWVDRGVEYVMTQEGPKRIQDLDAKELKNGRFKMKLRKRGDNVDMDVEGEVNDNGDAGNNNEDTGYRYRRNTAPARNRDDRNDDKKDSIVNTKTVKNTEAEGEVASGGSSSKGNELSAPVSGLLRLFQ
jgi:phage shock protein PspC (stress-responsive transcriptional regulator)